MHDYLEICTDLVSLAAGLLSLAVIRRPDKRSRPRRPARRPRRRPRT
ncbi:hypothetical protein [Actinoplanes utahensis]|nr:hypothetical protein [Actinoplanes utahensis]